MKKTFIVLNPVAGNMELEQVRDKIKHHLQTDFQFYETEDYDGVKTAVRQAIHDGFDKVIACGGDGTVSAVADALVNTAVPLGIIPVGTGNVLARELEIPLDLDAACQTIVAHETERQIDAMAVGNRAYISHISMGIYSQLIEHTTPENKQRLGRAAYLRAALQEIQEYPTWQFNIVADGQETNAEASMIMAANIGAVGIPPLRWGDNIFADDGSFTLCIVKSASAVDYFELIWNVMRGAFAKTKQLEYITVKEEATLSVNDPEVRVRADGEIIGKETVTIKHLPAALKVIIPAATQQK